MKYKTQIKVQEDNNRNNSSGVIQSEMQGRNKQETSLNNTSSSIQKPTNKISQPNGNESDRTNHTMEISTASSTDCTGMLVRPPLNEAELDSYLELYPYLPSTGINMHSVSVSAKETLPKNDKD